MFQVGDKVFRSGSLHAYDWLRAMPRGGNSTGLFTVLDITQDGIITLEGVESRWSCENFTLAEKPNEPEYTGGSSSYYTVHVSNPTIDANEPYTAECNDIIEALGMNFAEGNAFKAIWRRAAQRTLGKAKAGSKPDGLYDAQKVEFFGSRLVAQSKLIKVS